MRVLLLLLHLPPPMIDLLFNFVNSTSPALTKDLCYFNRLYFYSDEASYEDVFGLFGKEELLS